ncbi:hypothetical protein CEXT_208341 [Caerostris extrusa]|uniref:Uncharacterized protein n=1 Tax=Caerostris extrusa TaxID=172846 RepID=A0AAV4TMH4_CAEEX|nr:hypothetical protein CEXT_208341 [Caerostris extrusa]
MSPVDINGHFQKPMTSYGGTSSFVCAIEYQSKCPECSKAAVQNRRMKQAALATFVGRRLELEVNGHESIIGYCHSGAVGLMAYFGFIKGEAELFLFTNSLKWRKLPKLFMCNTAEGFAI